MGVSEYKYMQLSSFYNLWKSDCIWVTLLELQGTQHQFRNCCMRCRLCVNVVTAIFSAEHDNSIEQSPSGAHYWFVSRDKSMHADHIATQHFFKTCFSIIVIYSWVFTSFVYNKDKCPEVVTYVSHSVSVPPGSLGPSWWRILSTFKFIVLDRVYPRTLGTMVSTITTRPPRTIALVTYSDCSYLEKLQ
jgi:hypothetical protein